MLASQYDNGDRRWSTNLAMAIIVFRLYYVYFRQGNRQFVVKRVKLLYENCSNGRQLQSCWFNIFSLLTQVTIYYFRFLMMIPILLYTSLYYLHAFIHTMVCYDLY